MTKKETSERYQIPIEILEDYERWNLREDAKRVMGEWQYDDSDLELLGTITTLHDIGFEEDEIEEYMRLYLRGSVTSSERESILKKKRNQTLDVIHLQEKRLELLDYFWFKIQRGSGNHKK